VCLEVLLPVPPQCLHGRLIWRFCGVIHLVFISSSLDRISLFVPLQRSVCGRKQALSDPTYLCIPDLFVINVSFYVPYVIIHVCSFPLSTYFMSYFSQSSAFHSFTSGWSIDPFLICCILLF